MKKIKHLMKSKRIYMLFYPQIIELLRLLAAPFEIQISAFPNNEFPPDEIADEIEYKYYIVRSLFKGGFINSDQYESIQYINERIESFSKDEWTIEAMEISDNWLCVRDLAIKSLEKFGLEYSKPNIYWYPLISL